MRVHRFLCMAADAECPVILFTVVVLLGVYMMCMQVFTDGEVTKIDPALFVFAGPTMFRSVACTRFLKTIAIAVEWRSMLGMQWQSRYKIFRINSKKITQGKGRMKVRTLTTGMAVA